MAEINLNILIIEDEPDKAQNIKQFIESVDSDLIISISKSQVEALYQLEKIKFDLVILDMCLPLREDEQLNESGGENILDELDISDEYKRPTQIVALTQYDDLQEDIRNKYPELGAIKYSIDQTDWQNGLRRVVTACKKSKKNNRTIIYCEDKNDSLYNGIGLENIEFRGLRGGSRKVYESAKFEKEHYSVRDKDYLTRNEVKWLRNKLENYIILEYYCFENYLFHPDNMEEYFQKFDKEFCKESYVKEITTQKNAKLLNIAQGLLIARNGYFDFTDNQKSNMDSNPEIIECLRSDEFEIFYPYFDMKGTDKSKGFDRSFLSEKNIDKKELAATEWFKSKMRELFSKVLI